jgi:hypothetical protein
MSSFERLMRREQRLPIVSLSSLAHLSMSLIPLPFPSLSCCFALMPWFSNPVCFVATLTTALRLPSSCYSPIQSMMTKLMVNVTLLVSYYTMSLFKEWTVVHIKTSGMGSNVMN